MIRAHPLDDIITNKVNIFFLILLDASECAGCAFGQTSPSLSLWEHGKYYCSEGDLFHMRMSDRESTTVLISDYFRFLWYASRLSNSIVKTFIDNVHFTQIL